MKPVHFRLLALAAAAVFTVAGSATAQDKSSGVLSSLEVQQLVKRGEPVDNARLGAHFSALAERYAAEAKKHLAMAQSYGGNPRGNLGTGMSAHCKQLANLNTQSATTARELVAYHEKLAAGKPAEPPRDSARLQGGGGAPEPTQKELSALAAKASTPADHHALEEYFQTLAKRYTTAANDYMTLAQTYRGTRIAQAATIHDRLAGLARDSAKEATTAADMHKQLANIAK